MKLVQVSKSGRVLKFEILATPTEPAKVVYFDFKTGEKTSATGRVVKSLAKYFSHMTIEQIEFVGDETETLKKLFEYICQTHKFDYPIYQINTLLTRLPMFSPIEQILSAGYEVKEHSQFVLTTNAKGEFLWDVLPKLVKELYFVYIQKRKEHNWSYDSDVSKLSPEVLFRSYFKNVGDFALDKISRVNEILQVISYEELLEVGFHCTNGLSREHSSNISYWLSEYDTLVNDYGYNAKTLWSRLKEYCYAEALHPNTDILRMLRDTFSLSKLYKSKGVRYPKHLLSAHKIAIKNADFAEHLSKEVVLYERDIHIAMDTDGFSFRPANDSNELLREGIDLHHCVPVYHDRILSNKSDIYFMRKSFDLHSSYFTLEVDLTKGSVPIISHARGLQNTVPGYAELEAIHAFAKAFGFDVATDL